MSSSIDTTPDTTETSIESTPAHAVLSLFDQLKNSVDHNCVTKTALVTLSRDDKTPPKTATEQDNELKSIDKLITETELTSSDVTNNKIDSKVLKPEFHAPKLLPPPSGTSAISGLGAVSPAKRATKLNLKPPTTNIRDFTSLRSLKRSQQSTTNATQKTGTPLTSSSTAAGLVAATSGSSLSSSTTTTTTAGLVGSRNSSGDLTVLNHNAKKKRCTDRYDSSESSDR